MTVGSPDENPIFEDCVESREGDVLGTHIFNDILLNFQ